MENNYIIDSIIKPNFRPSSDNVLIVNADNNLINDINKYSIIDNKYSTIYCILEFKNSDNEITKKVSDLFEEDWKKLSIIRAFVVAKILKELYKKLKITEIEDCCTIEEINKGMNSFCSLDKEKIIDFYKIIPFPDIIEKIARRYKDKSVEINFLITTDLNEYTQKNINNFIGSREPYLVRIISSLDSISTYLDTSNNLIESPHDYSYIDYNKIILEKGKIIE